MKNTYSNEQLAELIAAELSEGFERELFQASLDFLDSDHNPLRYNAFAFSLRELLRHVRERIGPIDRVKAAPWFVQDQNIEAGRVTRRQGWMYAIQRSLSEEFVSKTLGIEMTDVLTAIRDSENDLSKMTHVNPPTFGISGEEGDQLVFDGLFAFWSVLGSVADAKSELEAVLQKVMQQQVFSSAIRETNQQIDLLSSNGAIEHIEVDDWKITSIERDRIHFEGEGTASVRLEWGRGDDHAAMQDEYPFTFKGSSPTSEPHEVHISSEDIVIDTSDWFGE